MRILGPIVQTFMLAVIADRETNLPVSRSIRAQFIRDHNTGEPRSGLTKVYE